MTVEVDGTALSALEMSKKQADESTAGVASENIRTTENSMAAAAAAKKSKRPNKRKRGMKNAPVATQRKRSGKAQGGGGVGGRMVGGVYFPG